MIRNSVYARLSIGLVLWLATAAHLNLVSQVENTPEGMLLYHGSAAVVDLLLLVCMSSALSGRLLDDMETLCLVSIVVNFLGWIAYLAYAPPISYNYAIGVLGYVQYGRLLMVDGYDFDHWRDNFFRGHYFGRSRLHHEKAQQ